VKAPNVKSAASLYALLAVLLCASPLGATGIPVHPDKLTYPPFSFTPPSAKDHRAVLRSGPVVYLAENRELPIVNVSLVFRGGTYLDPAGKEGLASLAGYLLTRSGTKSRTPEQLEERLAFLAAQLSSGWTDDRGTVTLNLLSKDLDEGLALLREVLTGPRFAEERIQLRKEQRFSQMKKRNDDSAAIEERERDLLAYGEGFYSNRYDTKASLDAITRENLVAFQKTWVHPRNVMVAVSGDVDRAAILKKLDALFAGWPTPGEAAPPVPKPSHGLAPGTFLVDKDVNQGRVSILLPGISRADPDWFPALVMNDVLGGGATNRLMNRIRSDEGLAYDAGSQWTEGVWYPGTWCASFQSKVRTAAYAAEIVLEEVKRIREGGVTEEELKTSKASFIDTFPRRFATKSRVAGALLDEEFTGRYKTDPNYLARYRERIEKVTAADAKRAADRLLHPDKVTVLAVGNRDGLLNPDPKHPVRFGDLTDAKLTFLPLRDPMTMRPPAEPAGSGK
jgi:predicted Zn-dependent peptidase